MYMYKQPFAEIFCFLFYIQPPHRQLGMRHIYQGRLWQTARKVQHPTSCSRREQKKYI